MRTLARWWRHVPDWFVRYVYGERVERLVVCRPCWGTGRMRGGVACLDCRGTGQVLD